MPRNTPLAASNESPTSSPPRVSAPDMRTTTVTMVPGPLMNGMDIGMREMSRVGSETDSCLAYSMSMAVVMSSMPPAMRNAPTLKPKTWNSRRPVMAKNRRISSEYRAAFFAVRSLTSSDMRSVSARNMVEVDTGLDMTIMAIIAAGMYSRAVIRSLIAYSRVCPGHYMIL